MIEIIALWIICKNIGAIASNRGVRATPYQWLAVALWFGFEIAFVAIAIRLELPDLLVYVAALAGAFLSLWVSFNIARSARPTPPVLLTSATPADPRPTSDKRP